MFMAERKTRDPNVNRRIVPVANDEEDRAATVVPGADSTRVRVTASHSRRERQARRRVQPLGEDESEEARDRGVPVPPVCLVPETEEVGVKDRGGVVYLVNRKSPPLMYISAPLFLALRMLCGVAL